MWLHVLACNTCEDLHIYLSLVKTKKRKIYNKHRLLYGVGDDFLGSVRYSKHLHIKITEDMHEFLKNKFRGEIGHRVRQMLLIYMGKASRADKELFMKEIGSK